MKIKEVEELKHWNIKKFKKTIDVCPNCESITRIRNDPYHAEQICEHCGAVIKERMTPIEMPEIQVTDEELLIELNRYTFEKSDGWIKTKRKKTSKFKKIHGIDEYVKKRKAEIKRERRKAKYAVFVDIINTEFMMSPYQKKRSKYILLEELGSIKDLCKNCGYREIIASICVYVMRRDKRCIDIDRNSFLEEVGLTEHKHALIMENLSEFRSKNM